MSFKIRMRMKRLLLAPLVLGIAIPIQAEETCTFVSQYQPDVTIEVGTKHVSGATGYIRYKGSPVLNFSTGIQNGYGGQSFVITPIRNSPTDKYEKIVSGQVVTVVGDQVGIKGTPESKRKKGQQKLFFPSFGLNYYYSLSTDVNEPASRFNPSKETIDILKAAEGFWIPSEICEKYVYYGWN